MPKQTLTNPLAVHPSELKRGDIMAGTVTCHIVEWAGKLYYCMYRCPFPPDDSMHEGIPQGSRIACERTVAAQLFPVVRMAGIMPDRYGNVGKIREIKE